MPVVNHTCGRRASDVEQLRREKFCGTVVSRGTDIPLTVKDELIDKLQAIPEYQAASTEDLIASAKRHFRVHIVDRYSAIAALISNRRRAL